MKYEYVFFDMDGVLVDTMSLHVSSWQKALMEFGIEVSSFDLKKLGGVPFRETISVLAKRYGVDFDDEKVNEIYSVKLKYFNENFEALVFDGVYDLLNFLRDRGVKMALVSGSVRSVVDMIVGRFFDGYFDLVVAAEDYGKGKPSPEPYLVALSYFGLGDGLSRERCVVVEDAVLGVEAGLAAGLDVFALETTLDRSMLGSATKVFVSQRELLQWFVNMF